MARGTVAGEGIVSQASTEEFRNGYERTFGDKRAQRGRWVWDARQNRLVPADEYVRPESTDAIHAPVMVDRYMEGTVSPIDGSDIGSRQKRRNHMKAHGIADKGDFSPQYRESVKKEQAREHARSVRSSIEQAKRTLYQQGKLR